VPAHEELEELRLPGEDAAHDLLVREHGVDQGTAGGREIHGRRAFVGGILGVAGVYVFGPAYTRLLTSIFAATTPLHDPQGAVALLPPFQAGLYVALFVAAFADFKWRPFVIGLALLGLSQIAALAVLHLAASHAALTPHVRDVRAWALAIPLLLVAAMATYDRPRH
jgi:hypothetical protein